MSRLWVERHFSFDFPAGIHPMLIERLRGMPARLEERLAGVPPALLRRRPAEGWSLQEHAGLLVHAGRFIVILSP